MVIKGQFGGVYADFHKADKIDHDHILSIFGLSNSLLPLSSCFLLDSRYAGGLFWSC